MGWIILLVVANVFAVPPDQLRAARRDEKACAAGNGKACREWTTFYGRGIVPVEDERRALAAFSRSCDARKAAACAAAATIAELGRERDEKRADALLARGCDLGDGEACYQLGTRRSGAASYKAHRRACDLGLDEGCTLAGVLLVDGTDGLPADPLQAARLLSAACSRGHQPACDVLK